MLACAHLAMLKLLPQFGNEFRVLEGLPCKLMGHRPDACPCQWSIDIHKDLCDT